MAIIIDSISFQNFYNYHGPYDQNRYELKEGLNLIVADNGAGKSKFFNGFLWILFNEVLDSETKKYKKVGLSKFAMLSDKTKKEAELDDEIVAGVIIEYSNSKNNFQIMKEIRGIKRSIDNPTDESNWEVRLSDTMVNVKSTLHHDFKPEYDEDQKKRIISNLLRPEFREYALLQGEEVDKIIDLTDSKSLANAIDSLSNIKDIEELGELSEYLLGRAEKDLDRERKDATSNKNRHDYLIKERNKFQELCDNKTGDINRTKRALTQAETEREQFLTDRATAEERQEIRTELKKLEDNFEKLDKKHDELYEHLNNYFFDDRYAWLLLGADKYIKDFSDRKDDYIDARESKRAEQKIKEDPESYFKYLAANVPDVSSMEKMLEKKVCFVCGRKAEEGSEALDHMKKAMTRPDSKIKDQANNNFRRFFDDLQSNTRALQPRISTIVDTVKEKREEIQSLINEKQDLKEKIELNKNELLGKGGSNVDGDHDVNILQAFGNIERRIEQYKNSIKHDDNKLKKEYQADLNEINKELESLSDQSVPAEYKRNKEVLSDLNIAIQNTKERILDRMITELEKEANKHFVNLTKHTGIIGPQLRFMRTPDRTVRMKVEDSEGNIVSGESEGYQRMKKLAVIMAIITSSSKGMSNYPFIADAPISAFGKAFTRGFFEEVPHVFNQSIILVKDLYDKNTDSKLTSFGKELLDKKIPSTLYVNEIEPGKEQIERETKIRKYL